MRLDYGLESLRPDVWVVDNGSADGSAENHCARMSPGAVDAQ
ncbi:MAG: hypothetical protein U0401_33090 [Anaerolineae bacterium]